MKWVKIKDKSVFFSTKLYETRNPYLSKISFKKSCLLQNDSYQVDHIQTHLGSFSLNVPLFSTRVNLN